MNLTPATARVLFCLSFAGLSLTLLSLFLRKDEEEDDEEDKNEGTRTSRTTVIEVKIPIESVGVVIGRGGAKIKEIQELSATKINFKDSSGNEPYRVCVIRGTPEAAQLAESLIHEFLSNQPLIETSEMKVPQRACGRIIGKNGDTIRSISRSSHAKINVTNSSRKNPECIIIIKGTAEEIEMAKSLITEKVNEEEEIRKKSEVKFASQFPVKKDSQNVCTAVEDTHLKVSENLSTHSFPATSSVFVSAVINPDHFWLQNVEPQKLNLVPLTKQMTEYYSKEENRQIHKIKELKVGQLVAAPFSFDDKWYRAEVLKITKDENDAQESEVSLYYVDYGDMDDLKMKNVFELGADFLQLKFQATECSLAKVRPKGDKWSEEAVDAFEELTYAAQWVTLTANIVSYEEINNVFGKQLTVPCIELLDSQDSNTISIAEQLVNLGFAVWKEGNGETFVTKTGTKLCKEVEEGNVCKIGGGDACQPTNDSLVSTNVMYGVDETDGELSDEMEMC